MDATLNRLVEVKDLKTILWKAAAQRKNPPYFYYDPVVDLLMLLIVDPKTPKIVHYLDEYVGLLYHPETREIIGLHIEAFEKAFLPRYAELQKAWRLSDNCQDLHDLGDLEIVVRRQEAIVARQISNIARPAAAKFGMELPAFA